MTVASSSSFFQVGCARGWSCSPLCPSPLTFSYLSLSVALWKNLSSLLGVQTERLNKSHAPTELGLALFLLFLIALLVLSPRQSRVWMQRLTSVRVSRVCTGVSCGRHTSPEVYVHSERREFRRSVPLALCTVFLLFLLLLRVVLLFFFDVFHSRVLKMGRRRQMASRKLFVREKKREGYLGKYSDGGKT